ncbi:MAG: M28 family metallopeptidase [Bacteriovoracia bacterium]
MRAALRKQLKYTPWEIFVRSSLVCMLISLVFAGVALRKIEQLPLDGRPLEFNGDRAFEQMKTLAKRFPHRLPWHENRRHAARWLKEQLRGMGYAHKDMFFSEVIEGKNYTDLNNIYVEKKGTEKPDEYIAVVAHFDTTDTTEEGAMDDASGVGVVLELARVFASRETKRSIVFLLTDSEEFGAFWGARAFAKSYVNAQKIIAAINLDFVAPEDQVAILTLCDGLKEGFTPLWLREMALRSIESTGRPVEARDFKNFMEFIERSILIPAADHGPLLQAGIPAFNWVGQTKDFSYQMSHYHHTKADVAEALKPASFWDFGLSAERLMNSLDELTALPENWRESNYLKVSAAYFLDGWAVTFLQILAFIPFILFSVSKFGAAVRAHSGYRVRVIFLNEAKNMGILLGSLLLAYAFLRLLPELKIITQYESFPATQKSTLLYNPNFLAIGLVALLAVGVYFIFKRTFAERDDAEEARELRHTFHAIVLAIVIVSGFLKNGYLTTLLLLPPAYFWTFMRAKGKAEDRVLNVLLLLGGSITLLILAVILGTVFHLGVLYWYVFLATAYGLVSVYTVVLFLMIMTVMARLFGSLILRAPKKAIDRLRGKRSKRPPTES